MKKIKKILFVKAQKAFKKGTGVVLCSVLMLFASCVKQKNCDYGDTIVGKFVYLKEPYNSTHAVLSGLELCPYNKTIVAHLIYKEWSIAIMGYIPHKFRAQDTVNVRVSFKEECHGFRPGNTRSVLSLKCIERE